MKNLAISLIIILSFCACENKKTDKESFEQLVHKLKEKNAKHHKAESNETTIRQDKKQ